MRHRLKLVITLIATASKTFAETNSEAADHRKQYSVTLGIQKSYLSGESGGMSLQVSGLFKSLNRGMTGRLRAGGEVGVTQNGGESEGLRFTTSTLGIIPKIENEWCIPIVQSICTLVEAGFGVAYQLRMWASEEKWESTSQQLVPIARGGAGISFSPKGTALKFAIVGHRNIISRGSLLSADDWVGANGAGVSVRYFLY